MEIGVSLRKILSLLSVLLILSFGLIPDAFATTTSFNCGTSGTYEVDDATHQVTGNTSCSGSLTFDASVTSIAANAFQSNHNITSIDIPGTITTIGNSAFNSAYFTSVTFHEGLQTIGAGAFSWANNFGGSINWNIPNSVTTIGDNAFSQTASNQVVIGTGVTSIGGSAFYSNFGGGPTSIKFTSPSSLTSLGSTAFIGFRGSSIDLPEGITSLGSRLFENANSLEYIFVPSTVTTMADKVFNPTASLKTVVLPDALTSISGLAFGTGLQTVVYCGSASAVQNYSYTNSVHPTCGKTVIFRANGGSGSMSAQVATTQTALTTNTYTRWGGYSFTGWNTKSDGSGTSYSNGADYAFTSNIVLYAQWSNSSTPGTPTIGVASPTSTTSATVLYTAPASDGGSTIDAYVATASPGGQTGTANRSGSGSITISGLTANTSYTFTVKAHNSLGYSANSSSSNAITTDATAEQTAEKIKQQAAEAERVHQEQVRKAKDTLVATIRNGGKIETKDLSDAELPKVSSTHLSKANAEISKLPVEQRTNLVEISKVLNKYVAIEKIMNPLVENVSARELKEFKVIAVDTPQASHILWNLKQTGVENRDTEEKIAQYVAAQVAEYKTRMDHLAAVKARIAARQG